MTDSATAGLAPRFYFWNSRPVALSPSASSKQRRQPLLPTRLWTERLIETPLISIVDDDDTVREATESLVRSLGFATRTFPSAVSFLQSSSVSETQCLILDVQMPNMSGVELQDHLSYLGFDIPIIFISAYHDEAVRARVLDAGAVGFLHKPSEVYGQRFVDCLYAALKRHKGPAP